MFTALELRNQLRFALDAENSDHYRDDMDIIPAINASIKWLTSVVNSAYGQDKIGEEFFRELSTSGVFRTSDTSRVSLAIFPSEVWSILAVYPKPVTRKITGVPAPATPDNTRSYFLDDKLHLTAEISCKRLNLEEWATNYSNPFEAGSSDFESSPGWTGRCCRQRASCQPGPRRERPPRRRYRPGGRALCP